MRAVGIAVALAVGVVVGWMARGAVEQGLRPAEDPGLGVEVEVESEVESENEHENEVGVADASGGERQAGTTNTLVVLPRSAWGASPPTGDYVPHTIRTLTVHHTAVFLSDDDDPARRLRGHQRFHQGKGFVDLAYHFVIDRAGRVWQGRPPGVRGDTFTDYDPTGHLLIVLEGNYEEQEPTQAQLDSLERLLAWAAGEFDVDPSTIHGHREVAATLCPGAHVQARLDDGTIRGVVDALLAAGGVRLVVEAPPGSGEGAEISPPPAPR